METAPRVRMRYLLRIQLDGHSWECSNLTWLAVQGHLRDRLGDLNEGTVTIQLERSLSNVTPSAAGRTD